MISILYAVVPGSVAPGIPQQTIFETFHDDCICVLFLKFIIPLSNF